MLGIFHINFIREMFIRKLDEKRQQFFFFYIVLSYWHHLFWMSWFPHKWKGRKISIRHWIKKSSTNRCKKGRQEEESWIWIDCWSNAWIRKPLNSFSYINFSFQSSPEWKLKEEEFQWHLPKTLHYESVFRDFVVDYPTYEDWSTFEGVQLQLYPFD